MPAVPAVPLQPADLSFRDGVPYAGAYGDVYHSADGGLQQARHVFMGGNGLPQRWRGQHDFTILETGFGLGLNFLATWEAWAADDAASARLHYIAIEKHPFSAEDLATLHAQWPALAPFAAELRAAWPALTPGFHRLLLARGRILLTLVFGDVRDCLAQIEGRADAIYLDGFAPDRNPDMWSPSTLAQFRKLAAPDATLATYTVAGEVRRALAAAGFDVQKRPGFGRKRHMLAARYAPRWPVPPRTRPPERHAIVLGAGIAGCAMTERLAARGWRISLVERHAGAAQEASGNPAGIFKPMPSRDDNLASRFTRAAFLFALQQWAGIGGIGHAFAGAAQGILQLAADAEEAAHMQAMAAGVEAPLLRWLDTAAVRELTGLAHAHGGWLAQAGGWIAPPQLCAALLAAAGTRVERHFGVLAQAVDFQAGRWRVRDAQGALIAEAPFLVLANGRDAARLTLADALPLSALRGQVTQLPAGLLPPLTVPVCGEGYVTPAVDGLHTLGATYDEDADAALRPASQAENLQRLARLLPGLTLPAALPLNGRVGFRSYAPDRLPLAGALPDAGLPVAGSRLRDVARHPQAYCVLGLGSRGMTWAGLLAEAVAAHMSGDAAPLPRDMLDALDPARFLLKAHRRGAKIN